MHINVPSTKVLYLDSQCDRLIDKAYSCTAVLQFTQAAKNAYGLWLTVACPTLAAICPFLKATNSKPACLLSVPGRLLRR